MQSRCFLPILFLATSLASAQSGIGIGKPRPDVLPGDGLLPPGGLNITAQLIADLGDDGTLMNDIRGAIRLPNADPNKRTYLVSQGPNGGPIKKYMEIEVDITNGNVMTVLSIDQPYLNGAGGDLGLTDLGWDRRTDATSRVWAGRAKSMASYDWQTQTFDPIFNPGNSGLGLKVLTDFQGNSVRCGTVANWDGQEVFVSADNEEADGTNFHEINLINFSPNAPKWIEPTPSFNPEFGSYNFQGDAGRLGAAFHPGSETVWWQIDAREFNPNPNHSGTRFFEMDRDGNFTGSIFQGDRSIGGKASGCDIYIDANGNAVMAYVVNFGRLSDNPLGITEGEDVLVEVYADFEFSAGCEGNIGYLNEPYIGSGEFTITLTNGGSNILGAAILFRGTADTVGLQIPGINNCPLNIGLGNFRNLGALGLTNGEASYVQPLPDDINLIGVEATYQWLLPTNVNVLPLNLSEAGAIRVGTNL